MNNERAKKIRLNMSRGFTLIEMIITLTIIIIVAAIAVPSFQRMAVNSNLKAATRDLAADFALYKERAIAESRMYRIVLDVVNGTYDIRQCDAIGSSCSTYSSFQIKNLANIAGDITFDSGNTTVTTYNFQTRGTVTNGTIRLVNSRASWAEITINFTGRTNVTFNFN